MRKVEFVVERDGRATLRVDDCFVWQIGRCSGIELLETFNKIMANHHLPYRLNADYSFVTEMLGADNGLPDLRR